MTNNTVVIIGLGLLILLILVQYVLNRYLDKPLLYNIEHCASKTFPLNQLATYDISNSYTNTTSNDDIPWECLFSQDFAAAKDLFLKSAKLAQCELVYLPIIDKTNIGSDVAICKGNSDKVLLHISGTHGPEGFAGSAVQSAALQLLALKKKTIKKLTSNKDTPTIVFVHALNAYGMAYNRRVNEDNIDLNRNFLTEAQFATVLARDPNFAGYNDIDFAINPTKQPFTDTLSNDKYGLLLTGYAAMRFGLGKMKRALVSGNYHKQKGLGYGGTELSKSAKNLIELVTKRLKISASAKEIIAIDVHTGLGSPGVDTLATLSDSSPDWKEKSEAIFPTQHSNDNTGTEILGGIKETTKGSVANTDGALSGYDLTVGTMEDFCNEWLAPKIVDPTKRICLAQEFGTVDVLRVGKTLSDENYAFFYGTPAERELYGKRLRTSFYVETLEWKKNVGMRGLNVVIQALQKLGLKGI
jgi:Protein of unknown function (DUF2817)